MTYEQLQTEFDMICNNHPNCTGCQYDDVGAIWQCALLHGFIRGKEINKLGECEYNKGREDAIDELKAELIDIILGNEEFIDWQKQEIILCLECAIENLKEQNK